MVTNAAVIRLEGVSQAFGDTPILNAVDLRIDRGEVVGIIGPGGHGKSVLLKLIAGLMQPMSGRIEVLGKTVSGASDRDLDAVRGNIGYLFQNYALFDFMTVAENVGFPLKQLGELPPDTIAQRVRALLEPMGLGDALDLFPRELSGGMKKRVGLARAVIKEPVLALYDDPAAGLDPVTSSKIFELIGGMQASDPNRTAVVVSHDVDRLKLLCHRYVMLYRGDIIFDGSEEAIAGADGFVRDFFYGALHKMEGVF